MIWPVCKMSNLYSTYPIDCIKSLTFLNNRCYFQPTEPPIFQTLTNNNAFQHKLCLWFGFDMWKTLECLIESDSVYLVTVSINLKNNGIHEKLTGFLRNWVKTVSSKTYFGWQCKQFKKTRSKSDPEFACYPYFIQ